MQSATKFIGLDVSKEKISVAIADAGRDLPRYYGAIPHTAAALRKLIKELGPASTFHFATKLAPRVTKPIDGLNRWGLVVLSSRRH
jgi:hypothetical protein